MTSIQDPLSHLQSLEAESIDIIREVASSFQRPVMMYSIGKDSSVMRHLARKAFAPGPIPFPMLHVDTTWKFREMIAFREKVAKELGLDLIVHSNPEGIAEGMSPFVHGSRVYTDVMKTQALKQALTAGRFDCAIGGARRDEEKSRAKERVFSFQDRNHRWDPKTQRPELWNLWNTRIGPGESVRAFPLSNWTELDVWTYIHLEKIEVVPLYLAAKRPIVERDGALIMVDDDRIPLEPGETPEMRSVRFRTLGCYPLTGAVESEASTLAEVITEMLVARTSERQGRVIDHDGEAFVLELGLLLCAGVFDSFEVGSDGADVVILREEELAIDSLAEAEAARDGHAGGDASDDFEQVVFFVEADCVVLCLLVEVLGFEARGVGGGHLSGCEAVAVVLD